MHVTSEPDIESIVNRHSDGGRKRREVSRILRNCSVLCWMVFSALLIWTADLAVCSQSAACLATALGAAAFLICAESFDRESRR